MMTIPAIINAYVRRIKRDAITVDDVPHEIREEVRQAMSKNKQEVT